MEGLIEFRFLEIQVVGIWYDRGLEITKKRSLSTVS